MIRFLLGCLKTLEQQGLRPNAVLIEGAANGPAVLQMLRRRVPGMLSRLAWQQPPDSLSRVATVWTAMAPIWVCSGSWRTCSPCGMGAA